MLQKLNNKKVKLTKKNNKTKIKIVKEKTMLQRQMIKGRILKIVLLKSPPIEKTIHANKKGKLLNGDNVYNRTVKRNRLKERGKNHEKNL